MDVIFFDSHLVITNKPAGISTQQTPHSKNSLEDEVKSWIKNQFRKEGAVFVHAVHRLDKSVSGLVLWAKTSKALIRLQQAQRERKIEKTYVAWVEGKLKESEGELVHYLVHDEFRSRLSHKDDPEAKCARLRYRVINQTLDASYVEIELETGRYHQIRSQFSSIGHPILNDRKYGAKGGQLPLGQIALHHTQLKFSHPVTQEDLIFSHPSDWKSIFLS